MMTETEVETKIEYGCCDMVSEKSFADLTWKNLQEVGTPTYTEEEMEFARQLQATVDPAIEDRDQRMYEAKRKGISRWCCFQKCLGKSTAYCFFRQWRCEPDDADEPLYCSLLAGWCCTAYLAEPSAGSTIGQKGAFYAKKSHCKEQHMTCIHSRNCEKKFRTNSMRRTENHMHRCMRVNKNKKKSKEKRSRSREVSGIFMRKKRSV